MANRVYFLNTDILASENALVSLLKKKDELSYHYLYDNYSAPLFGLIFRIVEREELANDALMETFATIWRTIEEFDPVKYRLFTWMLNIARRIAAQKAGIIMEQQSDRIFV